MAEPGPLKALWKSIAFYGRFAPSFTRIGYLGRGLAFQPVRTSYAGQSWLVTGATAGLGRALALKAARRGARVFAVGRNAKALEALKAEAAGPGEIVPVVCDLSSMAAVNALPDLPEVRQARVDVLVNNVGLLMRGYETTSEGFEVSYATNLLGHYVLTERLRERARLAPGGVILNVVSGGLYNVPLAKGLLNMRAETFNGFAAYAAHKRAQIVLTDHWRTAFADLNLKTYAAHPGWADTAGVRSSLPVFRRILAPILRNGDQGVDTLDWLAAARPAEVEDRIWFDRKSRTAHAYPWTREGKSSPADIIAYLERDRRAALG